MLRITVPVCCFLLLLMNASCPQRHVYHPRAATAFSGQPGRSLAVRVIWIKYKYDSFDVLLELGNQSPQPVQVLASSIALSYHGHPARHNLQDRVWQLPPGQATRTLLTFEFGRRMPPEGPAEITVSAIGGGQPLRPAHLRLPLSYSP